MPGRVPKELANLTKLTKLSLYCDEDLQIPDTSFDDMLYSGRGQVAAFQACLKKIKVKCMSRHT